MKKRFNPKKEARARIKLYTNHVHGYEKREAAAAARIENFRRIMDHYDIIGKKICQRTLKRCLKRIDRLMEVDKVLKRKERK